MQGDLEHSSVTNVDCQLRKTYGSCEALPFYREHEGKRYCVLHHPSEDKVADFKKVLDKKLESEDFTFRRAFFPSRSTSLFENREFSSLADFSGARFVEHVNFSGARFVEHASFSDAAFGGVANFSGATFDQRAHFAYATFIGEQAAFFRTAFGGRADFSDATFRGPVGFADTTFGDELADFSRVTFDNLMGFIYATFGGEASFAFAIFRGQLADFSEATFGGHAHFNGARFDKGSAFAKANFDKVADFSKATFGWMANFSEANFLEDANFSEANFLEDAIFSEAGFGKGADFSKAGFGKGADFSKATFKENAQFSGLKVSPITALDLQNSTIEKPERISFHTTYLRPSWFVDVDAQKFDFTDVEWFRLPTGEQLDLEDEIEVLRSRKSEYGSPTESPESLRKLTKACRRLMNNAEENRDYPTANEFHYWSMEAQRKEGWSRLGLIATLYWALSGYGERPLRALGVLGAMYAVFALLYMLLPSSPFSVLSSSHSSSGVCQSIGCIGQAATYSLSALARLIPAEPKLSPGLFHFLVTVEGLLGPLQIALFLLAVRRKVMR